jgi:hypothetical protein
MLTGKTGEKMGGNFKMNWGGSLIFKLRSEQKPRIIPSVGILILTMLNSMFMLLNIWSVG